jgi:hypothetical protein
MTTTQAQTTAPADWRAVLNRSAGIATLIGVPFIILLMYCAWLPLLMGMYFFILGGLLVGAIWYRLAARVRPVPAGAVRLRMFAILAVLVAIYMLSEYFVKRGHLARDMAKLTIKMRPVSGPTELQASEWQAREREAAEHVRRSLRQYGPGPVGYWIWAATDGRLPPMGPYTGKESIELRQRQAFYVLRVVASVVLLWYGLRLMAKDLARADEPVEIVEEAVDERRQGEGKAGTANTQPGAAVPQQQEQQQQRRPG